MSNIRIGVRKVGKKGEGLCLMLPIIWVRNTNISVGDTLKIEMNGRELIIEPEVKRK